MAGGGGQSQAEGRGRFMMRVMSAAPVVTDGSAEKATVPHPPPPSHPLIHHHHHTVYTQATHSAHTESCVQTRRHPPVMT